MKKYIQIFLIAILPIIAKGQVTQTWGELLYADTLEWSPLHEWISIENPESNIWEVDVPSKEYFNEAFSGSNAMVTDAAHTYGNNLNDWFTITIPQDEEWWGEGILSFYHKYDTDQKTDGGIIEIKYGEWDTWKNVKDDTDNIDRNFIGLYADTIKGGEYGFSGRSDSWQYVELYWWWLALTKSSEFNPDDPQIRFRFVSDGNDTQKEGWMIDDVIFRGYSITGDIHDYSQSDILLYPNPAKNKIFFKSRNTQMEDLEIILFNSLGQRIKNQNIIDDQIDITDLNQGIYYYKIMRQDRVLLKGKFLKTT